MREIKFRGLDLMSGKWVYGSHVKTGTGQQFIIPQNVISNELFHFFVNKKSVGQYTGLKDKNNVEIFEGDIVNRIENTGYSFVGEVVYEEYGFGIKPYGFFTPLSKSGKYDDSKSSFDFSVEYEIIGNSYENPDRGILNETKSRNVFEMGSRNCGQSRNGAGH